MVNKHSAIASLQEAILFSQRNMGMFPVIGSMRRSARQNTLSLPKQNHNDKSAEERIHEMVTKSSQVLFSTKTVFPFDFFPDTITINANKLDIVNSSFFASHQTTSIPLRDIANVELQTSPFFATLTIINIRYPMEPHVLNYLKKKHAIKAKNIIDGLLVALSQGADIAEIEPMLLIKELEKVGSSAIEE